MVSTTKSANFDEDKLVAEYYPKIQTMTRNFLGANRIRGYQAEDVEQELLMTLVRTARNFNPARGLKFSTYFYRSAHSLLSDIKKDCGKNVRLMNYTPIDDAIKMMDVRMVTSDLGTPRNPRSYTNEFKIQVVKEVVQKKQKVSTVARKYNLNTAQIRAWKKQLINDAKQHRIESGFTQPGDLARNS